MIWEHIINLRDKTESTVLNTLLRMKATGLLKNYNSCSDEKDCSPRGSKSMFIKLNSLAVLLPLSRKQVKVNLVCVQLHLFDRRIEVSQEAE